MIQHYFVQGEKEINSEVKKATTVERQKPNV